MLSAGPATGTTGSEVAKTDAVDAGAKAEVDSGVLKPLPRLPRLNALPGVELGNPEADGVEKSPAESLMVSGSRSGGSSPRTRSSPEPALSSSSSLSTSLRPAVFAENAPKPVELVLGVEPNGAAGFPNPGNAGVGAAAPVEPNVTGVEEPKVSVVAADPPKVERMEPVGAATEPNALLLPNAGAAANDPPLPKAFALAAPPNAPNAPVEAVEAPNARKPAVGAAVDAPNAPKPVVAGAAVVAPKAPNPPVDGDEADDDGTDAPKPANLPVEEAGVAPNALAPKAETLGAPKAVAPKPEGAPNAPGAGVAVASTAKGEDEGAPKLENALG